MKAVKITLIVLAAALLAVGVSTTSYAFHSGGVAECGGCHSMHSPGYEGNGGGSFLLVASDQSSACLTCHEGPTLSSYHVSTTASAMAAGVPPANRTPGGDFGWLKKTYTFTVRGTVNTEPGRTHGHNIVASDFGYVADDNNTTAPGGSFPSAQLACNSCHDPHGKYRRLSSTGAIAMSGEPIKASGSYDNVTTNEPASGLAVGVYRLLAGAGYTKGGITFSGVPAAKVPGTYNRSEAATQTRVAYGTGSSAGHVTWGNWCGTCHNAMHSSGNYVHPVDESIGSTIAANYIAYVKTGDMTGSGGNGFSSLAPFTEASGDYTVLAGHAKNNDSVLTGPGSTDKVNCMSCHRAHASGFPEMLRWNMENEFMVSNGVYQVESRGRSNAEALAAYYDRPVAQFASYQRVFCNKCHAKD
jgi:predicted CXXCH cytochrome family protein